MADDGIRVIIFRENEQWVAQCIDYFIGAQADTPGDLWENFALTFAVELKESKERFGSELAGIDPAPAFYEKMWEDRAADLTPTAAAAVDHLPLNLALAA